MSAPVETIEQKAERYERALRMIAGCPLEGVTYGDWVQATLEDVLTLALDPECWECGQAITKEDRCPHMKGIIE